MNHLTEMTKVTPINAMMSARSRSVTGLTSAFAGKIVPVTAFRLHREDRLNRMTLNINVEMEYAIEMLVTGVAVTARAVFVPDLAADRFEGSLDRFNRSYKNEPDKDGGDVVPFFTTHAFDKDAPFYRALGTQWPQGADINTAYVTAYNQYVNYLYRSMSNKLPQRTETDTSLAACPWHQSDLNHIVADFDQAKIDGEVSMEFAESRLPLYGEVSRNYNGGHFPAQTSAPELVPFEGAVFAKFSTDVFAELKASNVTLSLSNIEMAKKTAAFAEMRKAYKGLEDDHLVDLLMSGIRVPDAEMAQPILLTKQSTMIGYNRRYATDSSNLEKFLVDGQTGLQMRIRTPQMNTGGTVIVMVEVVPEQLYERQEDPILGITNPDELPNFLRDYLDPEKVDVVQNKEVDVLHSTPDATFGYEPLNHKWKRSLTNIGGKFYRQPGDAFDENRQRIWSVEQVDPGLTSDFYLATNIHHKVFQSSTVEPFEITAVGSADIVGQTVFGGMLDEDTGDYEAISEDVDDDRIDQDAV